MAERWVELRVGIDPDDVPMAQVYGDQMTLAVGDDVAVVAELLVPIERARAWAGELFAAVSTAYAEATGDPHALSHEELAGLPDPEGYQPASSLCLMAEGDEPARMRFQVALTIAGQFLSDEELRAALVEAPGGSVQRGPHRRVRRPVRRRPCPLSHAPFLSFPAAFPATFP